MKVSVVECIMSFRLHNMTFLEGCKYYAIHNTNIKTISYTNYQIYNNANKNSIKAYECHIRGMLTHGEGVQFDRFFKDIGKVTFDNKKQLNTAIKMRDSNNRKIADDYGHQILNL